MVDAAENHWPAQGSVVGSLGRRARSAQPPELQRHFLRNFYLPNPLGHI